MSLQPCAVCGWRPVYARGRCRPDYRYWMRHGSDKPRAMLEAEVRETRIRAAYASVRRRIELALDAEEVGRSA